jgi:hypothetical protein
MRPSEPDEAVVGGAFGEGGLPTSLRESVATLAAGLREPIVPILLLIAFFTGISGRPVNGVLLAAAAGFLAWDAGRRRRGRPSPETRTVPVVPARAGRMIVFLILAVGAMYAWVVGAFARYSWPATAGVVGVGAGVVALGWRGPLRQRPEQDLPLAGTMAWGAVLVLGGMWELVALFLQPNLSTTSFAHPTISALTDPVLATHPGRSVALLVWLGVGWFLVER